MSSRPGRGRGQGRPQPRGQGEGRGSSRGHSDRGGPPRGNRGDSQAWIDRGARGQRGGRGDGRGGGRGRGGPVKFFRQGDGITIPNERVRLIEDKTFQATSQTSLRALTLDGGPPRRPGYGTEGRDIILFANYFELLPSKTQPLNIYNVTVTPVGKAREPKGKKLAQCIRLLLDQLPRTTLNVTDFASTIIASQSMGYTENTYTVYYRSEGESQSPPDAHRYLIKVKFWGTITVGDLLDYLASTDLSQPVPTTRETVIQAFNILIGFGLKNDAGIMTKRNQYFPFQGPFVDKYPYGLAPGIEAFRGFFASVRAATGRILLNVQVKHIATYEAIPLLELLRKFNADGLSLSQQEKQIRRLNVKVTHLSPPRLRVVAGLANLRDGSGAKHSPRVPRYGATAKEVEFYMENKKQYISVQQYFSEYYRKEVKGPVINTGDRNNPIYLPAEVCMVCPGQAYRFKLSSSATANMIKFAVRPAADNATSIKERGIELISSHGEAVMQGFSTKMGKSLITVSARVREPPHVLYSGKFLYSSGGSWNMQNVRFNTGAKLLNWSYLWITTDTSKGAFNNIADVDICVDKFHDMMRKCGITVPNRLGGRELELTTPSDPRAEIENMFKRAADAPGGPKVLLVILPFQDTKIYNAVKVVGDVTTGIATVDVVGTRQKFGRGLENDNPQYNANVALKFNLKAGGNNQLLRPADLGFLSEGVTMLVGIDVTHPQPGAQEKAPSIAGVVASIDKNLGQWPSVARIQTGRAEMVEALQEMFESRLRLWQKKNRSLPKEILVYRDGVSEGQYDQVTDIELPQMRKACEKIYPASDTKAQIPSITIVICGKRHHTRFYPTDAKDADPRTGGTLSGTVVDRGVTETRIWDFYVQAHSALQGTPRPCHYVVVHDEIFKRRAMQKPSAGTAANTLEKITHNMCYMFGRATKAVSLCPPAYYADLLCERARRWISHVYDDSRTTVSGESELTVRPEEVQVHENLADTMYYI